MQLELREKELVGIGASIGAGCRPCIEHHIPMAREAGLSEPELAQAVRGAFALRSQATEQFAARVEELLGRTPVADEPRTGGTSRADQLVALGASVGANSHPLLRRHVAAALKAGLTASQIGAALRTAEYVQERAAGMTADTATAALDSMNDRLERSTT